MKPIVIAGAGLAGLSCARTLHRLGRDVVVLEASDHVGGRVWSDVVDGFVLDRGFQVLLDSYTEARQSLDFDRLNLHPFSPGALLRTDHRVKRIVDPLRDPLHIVDTIRSGAFTVGDMWRVLQLRRTSADPTAELLMSAQSMTTVSFLRDRGFSEQSIDRFFKPFFSGVFLEDALETPADMFIFVFRMFAKGSACLPAGGMRAIPLQLAEHLPKNAIRLNTPVAAIRGDGITTLDGEEIEGAAVVLATGYGTTATLFGLDANANSWRGTITLYYSMDEPPYRNPILMLNRATFGLVNNVVVHTNVCPTYSNDGRTLLSASILGFEERDDASLDKCVREELTDWFGEVVADWNLLRVYRITQALPVRFGPAPNLEIKCAAESRGVYVAGDYLINPSIDAAMISGRETAEEIARQLDEDR